MTRSYPSPTPGRSPPRLLKNSQSKFYPGYPHGMPTVHADVINADLLSFIQQKAATKAA